jgi:hypothetical protein
MPESTVPGHTCQSVRVRTNGWPYPFRQRSWSDIAAFLGSMANRHPEFQHMADIANSVIQSQTTSLLAACTSMHDLIVVPVPIPDPPYDVVAVHAPGSLAAPQAGCVVIEHLACTGHNDSIERPVADAVPLFWRFMIEKYGVHPVQPPPVADPS